MRINWSSIVRQIDGSRNRSALFYKPTCVIAALDLTDEGLINPENIDASAIVKRFSDYISPFFGKRGQKAYQPIWHLSKDGLWTFSRGTQPIDSTFFAGGSPNTTAALLDKFDRLSIHDDYIKLWNSSSQRQNLRNLMLLMLEESDEKSRTLVKPLINPVYLLNPSQWLDNNAIEIYFSNVRDQFLLFGNRDSDAGSPNARIEGKLNRPNGTPNNSSSFISSTAIPIENAPSPIDYAWMEGRIVVKHGYASMPVFPYASARQAHASRIDACVAEAAYLLADLSRQKWQVREEYKIEIERYIELLPIKGDNGNILLADAIIRVIREMFQADRLILPAPFAARLKIFMQQHIAIRPFYPEIAEFYRAVETGRIEDPLPLDAVGEIIDVISDNTPDVFDQSVSSTLGEVSAHEPQLASMSTEDKEGEAISPPPDPLGDINRDRFQYLEILGSLNKLWKIFLSGEDAQKNVSSWIAVFNLLSGPIVSIIAALKSFLGIK